MRRWIGQLARLNVERLQLVLRAEQLGEHVRIAPELVHQRVGRHTGFKHCDLHGAPPCHLGGVGPSFPEGESLWAQSLRLPDATH